MRLEVERNGVDFEDGLTPIAYIREELYLFSSSDGAIYRLSDALVRHMDPMPRGFFAVPGDSSIYSARVSDGVLRVGSHHLPENGLHDEIILGNHGDAVPVAVIVGGQDRYVALRSTDDPHMVFVSLGTGAAISHRMPLTARPLFLRDDGHVVYQDGPVWASTRDVTAVEPGIVTSWSDERLIVVSDAKGRRVYTEISGDTRCVLMPPPGWELRQAVAFGGGMLAICLHPSQGYATWDERRLAQLDGTAVAHGLGDHEPVIRATGYASGSTWRIGSRVVPGLIRPKPDLRAQVTTIDGCPSVYVTSGEASERLLVAFHGGPDSVEWDDLRYGGLYRDLLDSGMDVLIVNYAGSQGFGTAHQHRAWQNWVPTLTSLGVQVQAFCQSHDYALLRMLGVSFGAWAALAAGAHAAVDRIVVASPLLRLAAHIQRHEDDAPFREWAEVRFGSTLDARRADEIVYAGVGAEVIAIVPLGDRTIDVADTLELCQNSGWTVVEVPGGHYPVTLEHARSRWQAIARAIID